MVEQGLALETGVAEVAVGAVEVVAAPRVAVACDVCQTRALVVHVASAKICRGGEGLSTIAALLASAMLLLLRRARVILRVLAGRVGGGGSSLCIGRPAVARSRWRSMTRRADWTGRRHCDSAGCCCWSDAGIQRVLADGQQSRQGCAGMHSDCGQRVWWTKKPGTLAVGGDWRLNRDDGDNPC